jgi:hypothetical protein
MPGDATICQSGKTRKAFFQMTCVISRATPKITAEAGSTCASDAPWRGDGHSGQQLPYESRAPRRVVAFTSSLCSDSPGSVRACRQAFAGDPARTPTATSAFPFASSREAHGVQDPLPAAAISSQPVAEGRSRAGKPELHSFVPIRVHSWFNVTPAFPSRLRVFA